MARTYFVIDGDNVALPGALACVGSNPNAFIIVASNKASVISKWRAHYQHSGQLAAMVVDPRKQAADMALAFLSGMVMNKHADSLNATWRIMTNDNDFKTLEQCLNEHGVTSVTREKIAAAVAEDKPCSPPPLAQKKAQSDKRHPLPSALKEMQAVVSKHGGLPVPLSMVRGIINTMPHNKTQSIRHHLSDKRPGKMKAKLENLGCQCNHHDIVKMPKA